MTIYFQKMFIFLRVHQWDDKHHVINTWHFNFDLSHYIILYFRSQSIIFCIFPVFNNTSNKINNKCTFNPYVYYSALAHSPIKEHIGEHSANYKENSTILLVENPSRVIFRAIWPRSKCVNKNYRFPEF